MSLTSAIKSGISGLAASQQALNVISNNISNANVDGYTKKQANNTTLLLGDQVAGVQVASITRNADDVFLKNMRGEISGLSRDETISSFYSEVESIFGSTGDSVSLTATLTDLETRLQSLMTAPADNVQHSQIVSVAETLSFQMRSSVAHVQDLRQRVDKEIESSVKTINEALVEIEKLNKDISQASITKRPMGDLLDRRDQFLKQISEQMDVNTFPRPNDGLAIYTKSGQALLEVNPSTLSYTATGNVKPENRYEDGNFGPIEVSSSSLSTDLTQNIKSGKIAGLLHLRDRILPELTDQLENLSNQLMTQMNQAHNAGVPYPPPQHPDQHTQNFCGGSILRHWHPADCCDGCQRQLCGLSGCGSFHSHNARCARHDLYLSRFHHLFKQSHHPECCQWIGHEHLFGSIGAV